MYLFFFFIIIYNGPPPISLLGACLRQTYTRLNVWMQRTSISVRRFFPRELLYISPEKTVATDNSSSREGEAVQYEKKKKVNE